MMLLGANFKMNIVTLD